MKTMIVGILEDGKYLVLSGDTKWEVNPGDRPTVCTVTPTTEAKITRSGDSMYDHRLTFDDSSVLIRQVK